MIRSTQWARWRRRSHWSALALLTVCVWADGRASNVAPPTHDQTREARALTTVCAKCHNLQLVMDTPRSYDEWRDTVQTMVDRGASGTDAQFDDIMKYLHRTMTTINVNAADVAELKTVLSVPDPVAQAIVARRSTRNFTDLDDLKSVPGIQAAIMDTKARLIFFK